MKPNWANSIHIIAYNISIGNCYHFTYFITARHQHCITAVVMETFSVLYYFNNNSTLDTSIQHRSPLSMLHIADKYLHSHTTRSQNDEDSKF